jgi:hypothetical protein
MSAIKKTIERLWMSGHSEDDIVKYVSITKALQGNFCLQTPTIRRHVRSEIARLERKGLRPITNSSDDVAVTARQTNPPQSSETPHLEIG